MAPGAFSLTLLVAEPLLHEINTAAEAITAAADPDANIIFGATISPELDGNHHHRGSDRV
jgi:cell division GTPase FtsZ